jgi:predicted metalloprotease with PDZ domain
VFDGGAAQQAGLSAGDLLLAVDGLRVVPGKLETRLGRYRAGDAVVMHAFRRDELMRFELVLQAAAADTCALTPLPRATAARRAARRNWLGDA